MDSTKSPLSLISWNVNGLRAVMKKGFSSFFARTDADVFCLQETKAHPDQLEDLAWSRGYEIYWNPAEKRGYAGTSVITRIPPIAVSAGMGMPEHDGEGRVLALEFADYYLVNVYTPNSQNDLRRLAYRQQWDRDFLAYLERLEKDKPVVFCGDLNVAHTEIDLANPKSNRRNAGFTDEERAGFGALLEAGFVDSFRHFCPEPHHYTWWSYRAGARARNIGWRIDYWCLSRALTPRLESSVILPEILGSDHCPIHLRLLP